MTKQKPAVEGFPMIPNSHWLLGHLPLLRNDDFRPVQHKFSYEHADEHGRCCFYMGPTAAVSVTSARDAQLVLKSSTHRVIFPLMKRHMEECLGKHNIGVMTGKEWKLHRSAIAKALHGLAVQSTHAQEMQRATEQLVQTLSSRISNAGNDEVFNVVQLMKMLTIDIFGRAALSDDFGCCETLELSPIATSFEFLTSEMMRRILHLADPTNYVYFLPFAKNRRFHKEKQFLHEYIGRLMQERSAAMKESGCPQDLVTHLLKAHETDDASSKQQETVDETLMDVLMSLLFAGYETTSVALSYAWYLLATHPHVEEECSKELKRGWQSIDELVYTEAVLLETLRLYPPAISTTRSLEKPMELDGITIPKGTYLYVPIWGIQRDARHFVEPLTFLPERWVVAVNGVWQVRTAQNDTSEVAVPMANRDAFVAFSAGARSCVGQRFAMQEMKLALATLLKAFRFRVQEGYELTPYRTTLVQEPKGGLPMHITPRHAYC